MVGKESATLEVVFSFDATDQTIADNTTAFTYDSYGNLLSSATSSVTATTYAYDLADRLRLITQADTSVVGFSFDAAGRHATRTGTGGATIDTYSYLAVTLGVACTVATAGVCGAAVLGMTVGAVSNGGLYAATHINGFDLNDAMTETAAGGFFGALGGGAAQQLSHSIFVAGAAKAASFGDAVADSELWNPLKGPVAALGKWGINTATSVAAAGGRATASVGSGFGLVGTQLALGNRPSTGMAAGPACSPASAFGPSGVVSAGVCSFVGGLIP
jgi:YD repeat-containing protein